MSRVKRLLAEAVHIKDNGYVIAPGGTLSGRARLLLVEWDYRPIG
jgi:hypothetical protein